MIPSQDVSNTQPSVPTVPTVPATAGNSIRAAWAAILFAVLGILLGMGIFLIGIGLIYAVRIPLFYVGLTLAGICGLGAIVVGMVGLHRSRRVQPNSMLGITLARTAIWIGFIEVALAILSALVLYALRDFHL